MSQVVRDRARKVKAGERKSEDAPKTDPVDSTNSDDSSKISDGDAFLKGDPSTNDPRLRSLLIMRLQGQTQKEIAQHFGVSDRTIRNWAERLEPLKRAVAEQLHPLREIGRILCRYAARELDLLKWTRDAEVDGDRASMRGFARELRQLEKDRAEFLMRIGLFSRIKLPLRSEKDPAAENADFLIDLFGEVPGWRDDPADDVESPEKESA